MFRTARDRYEKRRWGRVEDPYLLDNITMAIREGIIGANGFRADYAVIVTWERMAYGGAPKITQVWICEDTCVSMCARVCACMRVCMWEGRNTFHSSLCDFIAPSCALKNTIGESFNIFPDVRVAVH